MLMGNKYNKAQKMSCCTLLGDLTHSCTKLIITSLPLLVALGDGGDL